MKNISALFLIFVTSAAFATAGGGSIRVGGGGGGGVATGSGVVLLDFYNEGLDTSATPAPSGALDTGFWQDLYVSGELNSLSEPIAQGVVLKIQQLEGGDPFFAAALVESLKMLSWRFVDSDLLETNDLAMSQSVTGAPIVSLAVRQGQTVSISRPNWLKMNPTNQIGLILHEVIEALAPVGSPPEITRHLVAHLFTTDFFLPAAQGQWADALQGFPSRASAQAKIDGQPHGALSLLYTRGTFLDPNDPYAFTTRPETLKLRIGSDFFFEPYQSTVEVKESHWPFSSADDVTVHDDPISVTDFTSYCQQSPKSLQDTDISVYAYHVRVKAVPFTDANLPPNLEWSLQAEEFVDTKLAQDHGGKASCTAANQAQLLLLRYWTHLLSNF